MRLSRILRFEVPVPEFTKNRFFRRKNALEGDRAKFYYWNLASLALTAVPLWYMASVNYRFCEESVAISELSKEAQLPQVDLGLYHTERLLR